MPGTREVQTVGGPGRVVQVALDPTRLRDRGVDVVRLKATLAAANLGMPSGAVLDAQGTVSQMLTVETGEYLRTADEVGDLVVGVNAGRPVYLREVARVEAGAAQPKAYVWHTPGVAGAASAAAGGVHPR